MRKYLVSLFIVCATLTTTAQTPTPQTPAQIKSQIEALLDVLVPPAAPAPPSHVIAVAASGDLQAAIDGAQPGDTIALAPGAVYTGTFVLRRSGITITTAGTILAGRMSPAAAGTLAKIESGTTSAAIVTAAGVHDDALVGLEVRASAGKYPFGLVLLGAADSTQTTLDQVPTRLTVDRCYIHGDPLTGAKRGIDLNSADTTITRSYFADIKGLGQDTQAIAGINGPGPYTITDNYLEAAGENVLFGGSDPTIVNLIPADILLAGNMLTKPLAWQTQKWVVKNALELKNAQRVHITGNTIEHVWVGGQPGYLVQLTVRDQSGKCPLCTVRDIEIDHNVIRHGDQGINVLGLDDDRDASGAVYPSVRMQNVNLHDNLLYDIGGSQWGGGSTHILALNNGPVNFSWTHNTAAGATSAAIGLSLGTSKTASANLQVRCSVWPEGKYGLTGDGTTIGAPSWTAAVDAASAFLDNAILPGGVSKVVYPAGNRLAAYTFDASYAITPSLVCADGKPAGADLAGLPAFDPAQ